MTTINLTGSKLSPLLVIWILKQLSIDGEVQVVGCAPSDEEVKEMEAILRRGPQ